MSEDDESTDSEYEYYDEDTEEDTIHKRAYRHVNDRQIYCALMDKKKELWIEVHDLRKVPPTIGDLVHLRSLTISSNQFLYVLPPQIGKLESLRVLKIHHKQSMSTSRRNRRLTSTKVSQRILQQANNTTFNNWKTQEA